MRSGNLLRPSSGEKHYQLMPEPRGSTFWENVPKGLGDDECWPWLGRLFQRWPNEIHGGYGRTSYGGKRMSASRGMYLRMNGPIPKGMEVCHRCDNRACVNPSHLYLATHLENMLDCARKKRLYWYRPDARNNTAGTIRLDEQKVREILRLTTEGVTGTELATRFGTTNFAIYAILWGKTWKWVPRPANFARPTREEWRNGNSEKQRAAARRTSQIEHTCACGRKTRGAGHFAHVKACRANQVLKEVKE